MSPRRPDAGREPGDPGTAGLPPGSLSSSAPRARHAHVLAWRGEKVATRLVADPLIGGSALNRSGLVTRNPGDFRRWFPKRVIRET